ncbi:hypothetical protein BU24DRAFT_422720 [Aaosphaeria arxii CBS 175.79]|uniref:Uncharacterized protein n=1 Tax=Aaosphaeria arxii CBS 175.79 TaxID=1450172 RepID=A0A6A5XSS2_9PLEO|nr:uncharacterized protein BU24DRAFT_422720 [Aaosphaeria arxii CBS 175.79]KAF2016365.1 hypothetical protein BU24DRAFT_422720 [Aaosphaeria arxii CBS 175.79]
MHTRQASNPDHRTRSRIFFLWKYVQRLGPCRDNYHRGGDASFLEPPEHQVLELSFSSASGLHRMISELMEYKAGCTWLTHCTKRGVAVPTKPMVSTSVTFAATATFSNKIALIMYLVAIWPFRYTEHSSALCSVDQSCRP